MTYNEFLESLNNLNNTLQLSRQQFIFVIQRTKTRKYNLAAKFADDMVILGKSCSMSKALEVANSIVSVKLSI